MAEITYGFVNDENILIEFAVVDSENIEIIEDLITHFNASAAYPMDLTKENTAIGTTFWNGTRFIHKSPYASWVWVEDENRWKAPIDGPLDGKYYEWDESVENWVEAEAPADNLL